MSLVVKVVFLFSVIIIVLGDPVSQQHSNLTSSSSSLSSSFGGDHNNDDGDNNDDDNQRHNNNDNIINNSMNDHTGGGGGGGGMYTCFCDVYHCLGSEGPYCQTEGQCFVYINSDGERIRNCAKDEESGNLLCHSKAEASKFVCCKGDYCNENLTPPPLPQHQPAVAEEEGSLNSTMIIIITVSVAAVLLCLAAALVFILHRKLRGKKRGLGSLMSENRLLEEEGSGSFRKVFGDQSSGSGSGQAKLVNRTVGKEVHLIEKIGNGRFGDVWRGKWLGDDVAVKIFTSLEETSWRQEMEIYNTGMLSHENILVFHASDTIGRFSCTQNLLIVQYHPNGSLYDYLMRRDIDMEEMLILASSAAAGISHLHYEIKQGTGTHEKPSIAHRDIKSKNILVKLSGECCIGDLGHAITVKNTKELVDKGKGLWVGTKRYMAPELLAKTLNPAHFESFRCADVYAFGLVLWEIARRARPYCDDYRVPFWDMVPADPSIEEMKEVVVDQRRRPAIPNNWAQEQLMLEMEKLILGCWAQNPSCRLNILRVKKNLQALLSRNEQMMEKRERLTGKILDGSTTTNSMVTTSSNYTIS